MKYIFFILAALFYLVGFGGCTVAKTAIGEIQGMLLIVIGTLFFIGAGIIEALIHLRKDLRETALPK